MRGWVGGACAEPVVVREALKAMDEGTPRLVFLGSPEELAGEGGDSTVTIPMSCQSEGANQQDHSDPKHRRADCKHGGDIERRCESGRNQGPDERADALERRGRPIREDQLLWCRGELRQERLQAWTKECDADTDDCSRSEDHDAGAVCRGDGRHGERKGPDERDDQQEPLPPKAVSQGGGDRRHRSGRQEPNHACDTYPSRARGTVGIHPEGDEVRPFGHDGGGPGQLGSP